ncbi:MAG: hypothetical protein RIF46_14665 [Cyclobacteriaceae bacterium]
MEEQEFNYNPIMYPLSILGYVTGAILGDSSSFDWLPWLIYGVATLLLIVALLRHRTIVVNENEITIKELLKGERTILHSEVAHYRSTYEFRKSPYTTWYFTLKNGKEIVLSHDFMQKEQDLSAYVNAWCSTLIMEPSA